MKHHLYLVLAMIIVGSSVTMGKFVTDNLPVNLSMFLRFLIAAAALFLTAVFRKNKIIRLNIRDGFMIAVQAFMGSVLFNVFMLKGLKTVPAVSSGIITGSTPVMTAVLSVIFLGEKFGLLRFISVVTATAGVIAVKSASAHGISGLSFDIGFSLILAAVLAESCFLIFRKILRFEIDSLSLSFYLSLFGMLFFTPYGLMEASVLDFASITPAGYSVVLYYGLFITVAAYLLWMEGIKHVDAVTASVYTAVMPLSAVVTSCVVLGESIGVMQVFGFIMIIISLWMVIYKRG